MSRHQEKCMANDSIIVMRIVTAVMLSLPFTGCHTAWPSDPTLQILCRLDINAIPPDDYSWVRLTDAKTGKNWKVFWFCGGTPATLDGAVGYFDSKGHLVTARQVDHLENLLGKTSALRDGDSLMLATLDSYGTGLRDEAVVILTLYDGQWLETFRCVGNYYCDIGFGAVSNRNVTLLLEKLPRNGQCRLIREVAETRYISIDAYDAGKPSATKRSTQTYIFDSAKMRFVEEAKQ
jgi:hypothetical protein